LAAAAAKADRQAEHTKKQLLAALAAMDMNDPGGDDDDDDDDGKAGGLAMADDDDETATADYGETPDGPGGIAVSTTTKEVFVADDSIRAIRVFDWTGKLLRVIGGSTATLSSSSSSSSSTSTAASSSAIQFGDTIAALALDGDELYVVDSSEHRIVVLNASTGAFLRMIGTKGHGDGQLDEPTGIAIPRGGNRVFVSDGQVLLLSW
jgi:DNA-binding beta-propeller fold protein YncE